MNAGRGGELSLEDKRALLARLLRERMAGGETRMPLSEGQRALWFVCQEPDTAAAYNTAFAARISSVVDVDALARAVQILVARHPSLRTVFALEGGEPVQVVRAAGAADFQVVQAQGRTLDEVRRAASDAARQPFSLDTGPLVRVRLFSRTVDDHVLVIVLHHLIQDGWSLWLLLDELGRTYSALAAGGRPELAEPAATYGDFVAWQAERLAGPEGEADWRSWSERLAGDLPQLDVMRDASVEPAPSHPGAAFRFTLDPALRAGLERLSREQGVTLNATLLAAFSLLLSRRTGQDEILVGVLSGGSPRAQARFADVVGYFVNPVMARIQLEPAASFATLLRETHGQLLDALDHQDFPFSRIVERLRPPRQAGRAPLAQAMFALHRPQRARDLAGFMAPAEAGAEVEFAGLRLAPFDLPVLETPFELLLDVFVARDELACSLRYATHLFAHAAIRSLADQFRRLLTAIVSDPQQPVGRPSLIGPEERLKLLEIGQGPRLDLTPGASVEHWLEAAVAAHADAPAVVFQGRTVSHGDLHRRANGLAHRLRDLGVRPGDIVAIALRRSVEMVVAVLAVFKSGGAYLPLDPEAPDERLNLMIVDSGATVILADAELAGRFDGPARVVVVGPDQAADVADAPPPARAGDDALAYVIYTSGSTGRPKGVRVVRRTLVNLVAAMRDLLQPGPHDSFLAVTSLVFDVSVVEIFVGLCVGARLVLADRQEVMDGARLRGLIETYTPRFMQATPSSWQLLLGSGWTGDQRLVALSAGEALSTWLAARLMETCGAVWNLYGPTEATVYATGHRLTARDIELGGPAGVTIGRPLANMQAYILDPNLEPVPVGAPGELYVGGAGVAEGYLGRPELTAERFISDPSSTRPHARIYKTGDLASWRADGMIEFHGRLDEQLKVRGHRIEPGEIEAVLNGHAAVAEAVVAARTDPAGDLRLIGYVALVDPSTDEAARDQLHAELRNRLARTLPDYMRPSALVFLDRLPRTSSGKIARRALPEAPVERPPLASAYVTPRSEIEALIAAVWMEVLNTEQVGIDDNFFDLGGHSLLAVSAQTRLSAAVGRALAPTVLLEHPTIRALAVHLAEIGATPSPPVSLEVTANPADEAEASNRIAIVGLACRVPGADAPEAFWRNLEAGVESIARFSGAELAAAGVDPAVAADLRFVPASGEVEGIDRFDAKLFGYSGRDAALMDPQQRVLLECAWEALEHAGYNGEARRGAIGVFAGSGVNAYGASLLPPADPSQPAAAYQQMLANEKDYLATRIAYKLDLAGPSLTVQTACSTSLVAVHLACQSLQSGACDLALAGGVSLRLPSSAGYLFQDGMILSPDGHCRAFDAEARGTVPGGGAGIVVLKRLSDAQRDGDTIHAVICGSALNNDGARKAGFTAPSLEGQASVVAAALDRAGLSARAIGYVEAHGTGTPLGDPIEIAALTRAFRASTPETGFCAVGSVKTNLGHLDAAAGVVGLIKTVLSIEHGKIPASLHFRSPNPAIDFAASPFFVNGELRDWAEPSHRRYAGVSAFGIGGANVHVVVGGPPQIAVQRGPAQERPLHVLTLSAVDDSTLSELAGRYMRALEDAPEQALADICHTTNVGRRRLARRHAIVGASKAEFIAELAGLRAALADPKQEAGAKGLQGAAPKIAFLFEDGPQALGLGRALYAAEPRFRAEVDRCADHLAALGHRGLAEQVSSPTDGASPETDAVAGFAIGCALAELWRAWGLEPEAVGGTGGGGLVAGVVAGAIRLEDGLRLALARGRVIAGRATPSDYADLVRATPVSPPRVNVLSPDGGFVWALNADATPGASLQPALLALADAGYGFALALARSANAPDGLQVAAVSPERGDVWRPLLDGLALCHRHGVAVDWAAFDAPHRRRRVPWPTYPFERARHWLERRKDAPPPRTGSLPGDPLLGVRVATAALAEGEAIFQASWSADAPAYLKDHVVDGRPVAPLTAYLQAALAAGARVRGAGPVRVRDLCVEQLLALDAVPRPVQAVVRRLDDGGSAFSFHSCELTEEPEDRWVRHASARLEPAAPIAGGVDLAALRARLARQEVSLAEFDLWCRDAGVVYGPAFRSLERLWTGAGEALGELKPPPAELEAEAADAAHPAWLDAALQVMGSLLRSRGAGLRHRPISIGEAQLSKPVAGRVWCHATLQTDSGADGMVRGDLRLYDADGVEVGRLRDVEFRAARPTAPAWREALYKVDWRALPVAGRAARPSMVSLQAVRNPGALSFERAQANQQAVAVLENLAADAMASALSALGGAVAADEPLELDPLMSRLGVVERHRPLMRRMLQVLEATGRAQRIGATWRLRAGPAPGDLARRFTDAEAHADIVHELKLLRRASERLADLLRGREDPLEVLFPRGDLTDATNLYERSLPPTLLNGMVLAVVEQVVAAAPLGRPVRILELGAGTGATAARLLGALPAGRFEYVFTDVSQAFLSRARKRFEDRSEVDYRILDVEVSPAAQGFSPQTFDIVVAANVLHTARDLGQALSHVRDLLAPGGALLAVEANAPRAWADVVFGATDGWWRFEVASDGRDHALLSTATWREQLAAAGFEEIGSVEPGEAFGAGLGHVLLTAQAPERPAGPWIVLAQDPLAGRALISRLEAVGTHCVLVEPGAVFERVASGTYRLDLRQGEQLDRLFDLAALGEAPAGVVRFWAPPGPEDAAVAAQSHLEEALSLAQALVRRGFPTPPQMVLATWGGAAAAPDAGLAGLAHAPIWGLRKSIALEHPELGCRCIDLDPQAGERQVEALAGELLARAGEPEVALRGGAAFAPRLVPASIGGDEGPRLRADGAYLITGGVRGLGLRVAEWMSGQGARDLVLVGRRPPLPEGEAVLRRLQDSGVRVRVRTADVTREAEVRAVLDEISREGPPLRGVVHAAGLLDDGVLMNQSPARFAAVMGPKAEGAWRLHRLTAGLPIEAFVVFSSIASLFGARAQANHAAANAFVDRLCAARRAMGLPAVSINWGPWRDIGAAAARDVEARGLNRGVASFDPQTGLEILAAVWDHPEAQVGAASIAWSEFLGAGETPSLFREMRPASDRAAPPRPDARQPPPTMASPVARERLAERVSRVVAQVLGVAPDTLDPGQGLFDMGLDSLGAITLRHALQDEIGRPLAATVVFRFSTIEALVDHLSEDLAASSSEVPEPPPGPATAAPASAGDEDWEAWSEAELAAALERELEGMDADPHTPSLATSRIA